MTDANITPTPLQLENRRKWVSLLRSDKYEQEYGGLAYGRDAAKRCCLGVACDATIVPAITMSVSDHGTVHFDRTSAFLPPSAMNAMGLSDSNPSVAREKLTHLGAFDWGHYADEIPLSFLNDTLHLSFAQIADVIERNFITPFASDANIAQVSA